MREGGGGGPESVGDGNGFVIRDTNRDEGRFVEIDLKSCYMAKSSRMRLRLAAAVGVAQIIIRVLSTY